MLSGHRSAWRRRGGKSRAARLAVPLAIPMAMGLTLGIILAVSGGNTTHIRSVGPGGLGQSVRERFRGGGRRGGDADDDGSGGDSAAGRDLRQRADRLPSAR